MRRHTSLEPRRQLLGGVTVLDGGDLGGERCCEQRYEQDVHGPASGRWSG